MIQKTFLWIEKKGILQYLLSILKALNALRSVDKPVFIKRFKYKAFFLFLKPLDMSEKP